MIELRFQAGTLVLAGADHAAAQLCNLAVRDGRIEAWRAPAARYAEVLRALHKAHPYHDAARAYQTLSLHESAPRALRPYQVAALAAWEAAQRRGVVVLPTGAGKTYVAVRALVACQRSALIVTPTIDLVHQWVRELGERFGCRIGQYGGGEKDLQDITVATYDSAAMIMPHHGHRFGLLVCDECHHLPAPMYAGIAQHCIAPWRLGLTATPEREDGGHARLQDLIGPEVHRVGITELEGHFLANYQAEVLEVAMDADELASYQEYRRVYKDFLRATGIRFDGPSGWADFLATAARHPDGRTVLHAWREQRRLSRASRAKLRVVWQLLRDHPGERCIIFTDDNATAYQVGRDCVLPVLTHHTKPGERKRFLEAFRSGQLPVLVTSRVLNEGVDVPEAAVGIIISGTGSVREHVQRLGRILRPQQGKVAVLYELVSSGTGETFTSNRRRSHAAFGEESLFP